MVSDTRRLNFATNYSVEILTTHTNVLPTTVQDILIAGKDVNLLKIDLIIDHLEVIRDKFGAQCGDVTNAILTSVDDCAKQTASNTSNLISDSKIDEASRACYFLAAMVANVKCLAAWKGKLIRIMHLLIDS
jgi:hypothetical protein